MRNTIWLSLVAAVALLGPAATAGVVTETIVHSLGASAPPGATTDGANPYAGLIEDRQGNFWGATVYGGDYGKGAVFEITKAGAYWVAYSFGKTSTDGINPPAALIEDKKGNFWGTTVGGGVTGQGAVFELTPTGVTASGAVTVAEKVVYSFGAYAGDAEFPGAGLVEDIKGDIWGTTQYGGASSLCPKATSFSGGVTNGCGAVFEISFTSAGKVVEKVVHSFGSNAADGQQPFSSLILDTKGNFWGTTFYGGVNGNGTVFEISSTGGYSGIYSFGANATDGTFPVGNLIEDSKGNFWGTTSGGGSYNNCYVGVVVNGPGGCGTVFKITKKGTQTIETPVYSFAKTTSDGWRPYGALIEDATGNFWGATYYGGSHKNCPFFNVKVGCGIVFKITPTGSESVIYSFGAATKRFTDGVEPYAGLIEDQNGDFWGTTLWGGATAVGSVFEIKP
jgi:uncharacterized repeat protein (TIGR03803 family)